MIMKTATCVTLALLSALALTNSVDATYEPLGGLLSPANAVAAAANPALGGFTNSLAAREAGALGALSGVGSPLGAATGALSGVGSLASNHLASTLGAAAGAGSMLTGGNSGLLGNGLKLTQGFTSGMTSGLSASMNDIGRSVGLSQGLAGGASGDAFGGALGAPLTPFTGMNSLAHNFKRSVSAEAAAAAAASAGAARAAGDTYSMGPYGTPFGHEAALAAASAAAAAPAGAALGETALTAAATESAAAAATAAAAASPMANVAAIDAATGVSALAANKIATDTAASAAAASRTAAVAELAAASTPAVSRQALALDAMRNAQTESALAGSEMASHGANNARSAALASNAYRVAKLASARDRVNIAGTIQNSARISDAAIATHDAATKAEDSLLGSELAVDSAATVLDSDGAYIPPVTNSLLRSLPYGRLGLRNIIPKPLTYTSPALPDVWLNGYPVTYTNIPLRALNYAPGFVPGYGPVPVPAALGAYSAGGAAFPGAYINQPFTSNNGVILNGMVFDPAYAYLTTNLNGVMATSVLPILANGQLEAQDELAMANLLQMQQLNGPGMSKTYQGYGRLNPVPMITGSVTDANLIPTTTIGTTYPIGSTLVIEPRDSFFQDYTDNASSRQNFDERQQ